MYGKAHCSTGNCSTIITPQVRLEQNTLGAGCDIVAPYRSCDDCGNPTEYRLDDCVGICENIGGNEILKIYICQVDATYDNPKVGSERNPATWKSITMCQFINYTLKRLAEVLTCQDVTALFKDSDALLGASTTVDAPPSSCLSNLSSFRDSGEILTP